MSRNLLRRLLFPPKCVACGTLTDWYAVDCALCPTCAKRWQTAREETCGICGERADRCLCVTEEMRAAKCALFAKLCFYRPAERRQTQNRVVFYVKEHANAEAFAFLARELVPALQRMLDTDPKAAYVLTYLPRTRAARLSIGHDQAERLAQALARETGIPFERLLVRCGGRAQKDLSRAGRIRNAKESFAMVRGADCNGRTVILIDDIVTTGAGMAAGARLLRRAGARTVMALAVASDEVNREMT